MSNLRGAIKPRQGAFTGTVSRPEGSGKRARRWLAAHFPGLDPYQHRVAWYLAGLANLDGHVWPAYATIAAACQMSERKVRYVLEGLVAIGAILEAGMAWTAARAGRPGVRTRRYRTPFDGSPEAVLPGPARRRLARLETARRAVSTDLETARRAVSTGARTGPARPLETARHAVSTASKRHHVPTIPKDPAMTVGAPGSAPSERTGAPPAVISTSSPIAAREHDAAVAEHQQRVLRLLSPVRSTAAHEAGQDGATEKPADPGKGYLSPKQARELSPADPRRNRYFAKMTRS